MADRARLIRIENDREITRASDPEFWYAYQRAVLLALKDQGILDDTQYRYAEDALQKQLLPAGGEAD